MYRHILVASFVSLVALAAGAASLAIWGAGEARYQLRRVDLASAVLQGHLQLKADSYALFRRLSDSISGQMPDGAGRPDVAEERAMVQRSVAAIRAGIAREIAFLRDREDEADELARLGSLARGLQQILTHYETARRLVDVGRMEEGRALFEGALRDLTSEGFRRTFDEAVEEEERETADAQAVAASALSRVVLAGQLGGGAALVLAVVSLSVLLRRLRGPLKDLDEVALAVAAGDLDRRARLPPGRRDEFARAAASLNVLVEEVARGRRSAEDARRALEATVATRTAELARANDGLQRADAMRRRFLADVSHELRTPITVIRGEAEVTLRGGTARPVGEYRDALARIAEQAAHTGRLVDDLLFVARTEAGEPRMAVSAVAFDALVRRCIAEVEGRARDAGLSVGFGGAGAEVVVQGDAGRLRQAVVILLDNALRYSEAGAPIEVTLVNGPGGVTLRVADRGIGIGAEELPHLFDRFWRGARAVVRHAEGSGLGLPLAKAIVEAHGGTVALEGRSGGGTVATINLPAFARLRAVA